MSVLERRRSSAMKLNINNISIFNKIIGYSLVLVLFFSGVIYLKFMPELEETIYSEKQNNIRQNVEVAYSVFESKNKLVQEGKLTEKEAKAEAKEAIKHFKYDNGEGYFWINDYEPNMIMHPVKSQLDGSSLKDSKDPNGKRLFVEMVNVVKQKGEGFVDYQWAKPGFDLPVDKISFVKGFDKWKWIIGSGIYVDDIEAKISSVTNSIMLIFFILVIGVIVFTYFLAKNISVPIKELNTMSLQVAEGNVNVTVNENRGDEIGMLARSFNKIESLDPKECK